MKLLNMPLMKHKCLQADPLLPFFLRGIKGNLYQLNFETLHVSTQNLNDSKRIIDCYQTIRKY
jgi:hypothetical protein